MEKIKIRNIQGIMDISGSPDPAGKPLIVFLHGIGERGTDINLVLKYGPLWYVKEGVELGIDAVIIHPQIPKTQKKWSVADIVDTINIGLALGCDPNRVYLLGVSLGGWGVWEYLASEENKIAAAVLMAPGGNPKGKEEVIANKNVPIWVAHGAADKITKLTVSRAAVEKINSYGKAYAQLSSIGLGGHNTGSSWGRFMEPQNFYLWEWLKRKSKNSL